MSRRNPIEIHFPAIMALVVTMVACQWDNTLYHCSRSCGNAWSRDSALSYDFSASEPFRCEVELRYDKRFPYQKVWLKVMHNLTVADRWETDTIGVALYDESGEPFGKGMGGIYQLSVPFMTFPDREEYEQRMSISHCMDDDALVGISDIGVRIVRP